VIDLRADQVDAFERRARDHFRDRVVRQVTRIFPGRVGELGEARTREVVEGGIARARERGFRREREIMLYVDLYFGVSLDFEERPDLYWMADFLDAPNLDPADRLDRLYAHIRARDQAAARTVPTPEG